MATDAHPRAPRGTRKKPAALAESPVARALAGLTRDQVVRVCERIVLSVADVEWAALMVRREALQAAHKAAQAAEEAAWQRFAEAPRGGDTVSLRAYCEAMDACDAAAKRVDRAYRAYAASFDRPAPEDGR